MIVPAAFVLAGLAAWLHFETVGRVILPGLTVWIGWYAAVLLALCVSAARARDEAMAAAAAVMVLSFAAVHLAWNVAASPIVTQSVRCLAVAAVLFGVAYIYRSRAIALAGAAHLAIVGFAAMTDLGFVFSGRRPPNFLAWSFPDVSAGLQHGALLAISSRGIRREIPDLGRHSGAGPRLRPSWAARLALPWKATR